MTSINKKAALYLSILCVIIIYLFRGSCLANKVNDFPSESFVNTYLKAHSKEADIITIMGEPTFKDVSKDGTVILNYLAPPPKPPVNDNYVYAGFTVYIKNGQMTHYTIIHASHHFNE
jgi:hypothetical protein